MQYSNGSRRSQRADAPNAKRTWRRPRSRRGVSDVIATIILLALTVTLFSAIFAFVSSFPSPPAQNSNQFQANLVTTSVSNGTQWITGINITHLAGPLVSTTSLVYLKSAASPSHCPFLNPVPVSNDSSISGPWWSLGQVWGVSFDTVCGAGFHWDQLPDNITVYIVSGSNLLFSQILPGSPIHTAPQVVSTWVSPSPVREGSDFTVNAIISGSFLSNSVYVKLLGVPGFTGTAHQMTFTSNVWAYTTAHGPTGTGVYTGFINVTGTNGASVIASVSIPVISNAGGISVVISAVPSSGNTPLLVHFAASVSGANGSISYSWGFGDGNTSTLATPQNWYNTSGSYLVSLTVTDHSGNQGSATQTVTVTYQLNASGHASAVVNYGYNYANCYGYFYPTSCPINVYWEVWNNGSKTISVSGTEYLNDTTSGAHVGSWSLSKTVNPASATGKLTAKSGVYGNYNDQFSVTLVLSVTINGQPVGIITSSFTFTMNG